MDVLDLFFKKYSYKFPKGYPDMNNNQDVLLLENILKEIGIKIKLFEEVNFGVLKNIAGSEINDDTLKKIQSGDTFNLNLDNIYLSSGGSGKKYGGKDRYNINDLRTLIKEFDKPIILTYAGNVRKFRTPFGVRICAFNAPSNEKSPDFARLIVVNKLLEEYCNKYNYIYFNPYSYYENDKKCLNVEDSDTIVHLKNNSYFLEQFNILYKNKILKDKT